jgi:hypothetical protein
MLRHTTKHSLVNTLTISAARRTSGESIGPATTALTNAPSLTFVGGTQPGSPAVAFSPTDVGATPDISLNLKAPPAVQPTNG